MFQKEYYYTPDLSGWIDTSLLGYKASSQRPKLERYHSSDPPLAGFLGTFIKDVPAYAFLRP